MTNCDHPCIPCWLLRRRRAAGSWLFRHMPGRHRRVMRAAMGRRRRWRLTQRMAGIPEFLWDNPREEHRFRRIMREIDRDQRRLWSEGMKGALALHIPRFGSLVAPPPLREDPTDFLRPSPYEPNSVTRSAGFTDDQIREARERARKEAGKDHA